MKFLYLFCLFAIGFLRADVFDHLKTIDHKSGDHSIDQIDFIYMINLDQRPEKFRLSCSQLLPYGIHPFRFSAVNGWELTLDDINDMGVKFGPWMTSGIWGTWYPLDKNGEPHHEVMTEFGRNYFCHCMSPGAIGIVCSHLSILQDAYNSGYETIWVMEDDIEVIRNPHLISDLIVELDKVVGPNNWDILFTDQDTKNREGQYVPCLGSARRPNFTPSDIYQFARRYDVSPDFRKIGARYGAYSMIVRRSGMKKILDFYRRYQVFLPFDMDFILVPDIQFYNVRDDVVSTQPQALSDNGGPNYLKK